MNPQIALASSLAANFVVGSFIGQKSLRSHLFQKLPSAAPNVPPGHKLEEASSWSSVLKACCLFSGPSTGAFFMIVFFSKIVFHAKVDPKGVFNLHFSSPEMAVLWFHL